jgi:hypothetical protein
MNVERKKEYNQVCVWPATIIGKDKISEFEKYMMDNFQVRVQYLEEIKTFPNRPDDKTTGGRNDVFFSVHDGDVGKFAIPRLSVGIRWIEDVLSKENYRNKIYPKRVFAYKSWDC